MIVVPLIICPVMVLSFTSTSGNNILHGIGIPSQPITPIPFPLNQRQSSQQRIHINNNNIGRTRRQSSSSNTLPDTPAPSFYIRKALYTELPKVADILIASFYNPSPLVRPYLYLSELSRLQSNFPYGGTELEHVFFVACSNTTSTTSGEEEILGFVDIDARPSPKPNTPPRPYLSDLAVRPSHRRIGVARSLIIQCELQSRDYWDKTELFLRVEEKNDAALKMYGGLGYEKLSHAFFGVRDTTILLRRGLVEEEVVEEGCEVNFWRGGKGDCEVEVEDIVEMEDMGGVGDLVENMEGVAGGGVRGRRGGENSTGSVEDAMKNVYFLDYIL